jgi:hypothetical protein
VQGQASSELDVRLLNRCFDDGSDLDDTAVFVDTKRVGRVDSAISSAEIYLRDTDDNSYGKDLDLRKIMGFDQNASMPIDFPQADVIELANTETTNFNTARSLTLSNDLRVYYGTYEPVNDNYNGGQYISIKFNLTPYYLQPELGTIPNQIVEENEYNLEIRSLEEDQIVYNSPILLSNTDYEIRIDVPKGHYEILLEKGPAIVDTSLIGFTGSLTVEQVEPVNGSYQITDLFNCNGESTISFGESLKIRFDVRAKVGFGWMMLYDPSNGSLIENSLNLNEALFECSTATDSVSCVETPDGFILIYMSDKIRSFTNQEDITVDSYLHGIEGDLSFIKYNFLGQKIAEGKIDLEPLSGQYIHAFDCYSDSNGIYIIYSIRSNNVEAKTNTRFHIGENTYTHPRISSASRPYILPEMLVKYMPFSTHNFDQDESTESAISIIPIKSLNNIGSTYKITGGGDNNKGVISPLEKFMPAHTTGADFIRVSYDRSANIGSLSIIDKTYRLPLVMSGKAGIYREVAMPPFFSLQSFDKTKSIPLRSIDSAYGIDGRIWTVASTLSVRPTDESVAYDTAPKVMDRFQMMALSTEILESNRLTFLERSADKSWFNWLYCSGYEPLKNFLPMPILNETNTLIEADWTYEVDSPEATSFSASVIGFTSLIPNINRNDIISIAADKQMFIIGQSGTLSKPPDYFSINHFDRHAFNVPLGRHLDSRTAVIDPGSNDSGKILVYDASFGALKMNHIEMDLSDESYIFINRDKVAPDQFNRYLSLNTGSRHKFVIDVADMTSDPISIIVNDVWASNLDLSASPDISSATTRIDISVSSSNLIVSSYTDVLPYESISIPLQDCYVYEFNVCQIRSGDQRYDSATIIRSLDHTSKSFKNDAASKLSGPKPLMIDEDYSLQYSKRAFKSAKTDNVIIEYAGNVNQLIAIGPTNTGSSGIYRLLYYQSGSIQHEGLQSYLTTIQPLTTYIENALQPQQGDSAMPSDIGFVDMLIDKSRSGLAVANSKEIYLTNGFSSRFIGSNLSRNTFTMQRTEVNSPNSIKTNNLQGRWLSESDNITVKLWADAQDSGLDKLYFNRFAISGTNVSQFFIIVRDSEEESWRRVQYIDTSIQGWSGLSANSYSALLKEIVNKKGKLNPSGLNVELIGDLDSFRTDLISSEINLIQLAGDVYTSDDYITPFVDTTKQMIRSGERNENYRIGLLQDDRITVIRSDEDVEIPTMLTIFNEDYQQKLVENSARFVGIEIPPQKTYEGYYTIGSLEIGKSDQIGQKFSASDQTGISLSYNIDKSYLIDSASFSIGFKNIERNYMIEYAASSKLDYLKLKSMIESISLSNDPIWIFEEDSTRGYLCLCSESPKYEILLDDDNTKIYTISIKMRVVK